MSHEVQDELTEDEVKSDYKDYGQATIISMNNMMSNLTKWTNVYEELPRFAG